MHFRTLADSRGAPGRRGIPGRCARSDIPARRAEMLQGPPYSTEQRTLMGLLLPSADLTRSHYDIMDERADLSVHDIMVREFGDDYLTILIPNCPQRAQLNDRPWWR